MKLGKVLVSVLLSNNPITQYPQIAIIVVLVRVLYQIIIAYSLIDLKPVKAQKGSKFLLLSNDKFK